MAVGKDYLQEVQKFISSQYWYSGWRITAGVMVPLLVFILAGNLSVAIPFLWGSLFVSLTDTPGPIHHRRNGMIAATLLNTFLVLLTALTKGHPAILVGQVVVLGFFLTMAGIYGGRAGAVGTLALVIMLLNLLSINNDYNTVKGSLLIGAGGAWYTLFSLLLYRIRPYRAVEQALGEHLIAMADYIRSRAAFYREGSNLSECFHRVMKTQSDVRDIQHQTQELLFKTRRIVGDASPKSRSLMMIYLDSLDLFEQSMYAYQDYEQLHQQLDKTGLLNRYYGLILELAAGLEYIGITVQTGNAVKKDFDLTKRIGELERITEEHLQGAAVTERKPHLEALNKILKNVQDISNRINRIILYTRMEADIRTSFEMAQKISRIAATQPLTLKVLRDNLSFKSDIFRHAIRLTVAMIAGYAVSLAFSLSHSYWVLLTIVTILKPAYVHTKKRNIERVAGTLVGVVVVSVILSLISNTTVLLVILVLSMLLGYSLLRVHYFTFVIFLTIFLIISLYFLNPYDFQNLIRERLIDTLVGSVIAFLVSRFIFPVWGHHEIKSSMEKMLEANRQYFYQAWIALKTKQTDTPAYALARQDAIVSLTNLSDNFQRILSEPQQTKEATPIHQFVIASHMLTGHIAALSDEHLSHALAESGELEELAKAISYELQCAEDNLRHSHARTDLNIDAEPHLANQSLTQLSMIYAIAYDLRKITARLFIGRNETAAVADPKR
ncbi:MAG: FUSC family membrane protein [Chryseosolibacter sp.]